MKRFNFCSVFIVCYGIAFLGISARDVQETVLRAHKLFEQGEVDQALKLYSSIQKKGPATWYNEGLCHYKQDNFIDALVCLRKAEHNASWTELSNIYYMIDQVYKSLAIDGQNTFIEQAYRATVRILSLLTLYGWQLIFLLVWTLVLFLSARLARREKYLVLTMLGLLVILSASALYIKYDLCNNQYGIVLNDKAIVYAGPDKEFHELATLAKADELSICERKDRWLKICHDRCIGWICDDNIAII